MTALPVQTAPAPRRSPPPKPERRLRPVPEPMRRTKPRVIYAIVALAGVALIVVAQLLLSIALAQGAYEIDAYQMRQAELARQEQKLADGAVLGEPTAATGGAAASAPLVPNSLLDGVPTVTERHAARTPTAGASDRASTAAPAPPPVAPPPPADGLPTPATH